MSRLYDEKAINNLMYASGTTPPGAGLFTLQIARDSEIGISASISWSKWMKTSGSRRRVDEVEAAMIMTISGLALIEEIKVCPDGSYL